jgi:hypothetical protein
VRGQILGGWARTDPQAAWAWYQKAWEAAPEPRYRLEQDVNQLFYAWALRDPKAAIAAALTEGEHGTYDKWYGIASLAALPERREEIMALLMGIPDEKKRAAASRAALLQWSASAPAEAAAWVDAHLPNADHNILWSIAERYGRANPRANADWLMRRTPQEKRDEAYSLCLYQWAAANPAEAGAWLEGAGVTDQSAQIMASSWLRTHPGKTSGLEEAMTWARRVSPAARAEAIVNTLAQARNNGEKPDLSSYAADAGMSAEDLSIKVEEAAKVFGSRL